MAKDIYDMTDDELEAAFLQAKADLSEDVSLLPSNDLDEDEINLDYDIEQPNDEHNEEETEITEQPEATDSDNNSDDANVDNGNETDPAALDEDKTEQPEGKEVDTNDKAQDVPQTYKIKANGNEFDFSIPELLALAPKAMDYTKKMQELAPWRKQISALKDNNISQEDLNLMIDVLKGDKEAVASMIKRTGIDALEIDTDNINYTPKSYGRDESELAIQDIIDKYSDDVDFGVTADVVANKFDTATRNKFFSNPSLIEELHVDVKNGFFRPVFAEMQKLKAIDGARKSDLDYYIEAGTRYHAGRAQEALKQQAFADSQNAAKNAIQEKIVNVQKQEVARTIAKTEANVRKAAAPTRTRTPSTKTVVDYLNESDENYDEWYSNIMNNH